MPLPLIQKSFEANKFNLVILSSCKCYILQKYFHAYNINRITIFADAICVYSFEIVKWHVKYELKPDLNSIEILNITNFSMNGF